MATIFGFNNPASFSTPVITGDITDNNVFSLHWNHGVDTSQSHSSTINGSNSRFNEQARVQNRASDLSIIPDYLLKTIEETLSEINSAIRELSVPARGLGIGIEPANHFELNRCITVLNKMLVNTENMMSEPSISPATGKVLGFIHGQVGSIIPYLKQLDDGSGLDQGNYEEAALALIELRFALKSLQIDQEGYVAQQILADNYADIQARDPENTGKAVIRPDEPIYRELFCKQVLARTVLPQVQNVIGQLIHDLIPFNGILRQRIPSPVGFSFLSDDNQPELLPLIEKLTAVSGCLENISAELKEQTLAEIQYRAFLSTYIYHIDQLAVQLSRQNIDGIVNESSVPIVREQCEQFFRIITSGLNELKQVAYNGFSSK